MKAVRVAAVSYLNTKPLLWGLEQAHNKLPMELQLDYPAALASMLGAGEIDLALLPVAAISSIPGARIVSRYGIAADGEVASVAVFSQVPLEQIERVYLDYQSRTSVRLTRLLFEQYWNKEVEFLDAPEDYISKIQDSTAGVIIGDRALQALPAFEYVYDLATAWQTWTGLPFVFAAWVATKELPGDFMKEFDLAQSVGLSQIDAVVKANPFAAYSLHKYYTENIQYEMTEERRKGLEEFLRKIA
jgi:chorismate dehydratase